jgi:microcystin degradation protein MlrC
MLRIGIGGISVEANDFVPPSVGLAPFEEAGFLLGGQELFSLRDANVELAGALDVLGVEHDVEIIPLIAARGIVSGRLEGAAYIDVRDRLLAAIAGAGPLDGIYLFQHGSMEAVGEDDPEGDIAARVRAITDVPLVMSCDLHGNVTQRMVEATAAIVAYKTYPHDDVRETGQRAASLLLRAARGEVRPATSHVKLDMMLTAFNSTTLEDTAYARLIERTRKLEAEPRVLSASVMLVGSYIDNPDAGCSVIVVTNDDQARGTAAARELAREFWDCRREFAVETVTVAEAVTRGRALEGGPVLLLDTADTTGGGAAGDSVALVRGLLEAGVDEPALATVVDPDAARACHEAGEGAEVRVRVGHSVAPRWGEPLELEGRVSRLLDGRFRYTGGIFGGIEVSMGPSAVLTVGSLQLLITTGPTYEWATEQYDAAGLDPSKAKFVGVKNMMNFRFGYAGTMKAFFVLDLPGPTPSDLRALAFERLRSRMYPFDPHLADPGLRITESRL